MKFAVILDANGRGSVRLLEVVADPTPIRVSARITTLAEQIKKSCHRLADGIVAIEIDTDEAVS